MSLENLLLHAGIQAGLIDSKNLPVHKLNARKQKRDLLPLVAQAEGFALPSLYMAVAKSEGLRYLDRDAVKIDSGLVKNLNADVLLRRLFLPAFAEGQPVALCCDPKDRSNEEALVRVFGRKPELVVSDAAFIEAAIRELFERAEPNLSATDLLDHILFESHLRKATDIHMEPVERGMMVRFRVDGQMQHYERYIDLAMSEALISRVKVLGGLDIAEQNMAQDGGFSYRADDWLSGAEIELRLATIPTRWGERATLRVLGQGTQNLNLAGLGMSESMLGPTRAAIRKPHGIVLVTGPTGSGKSTTLYAALRELDAGERNILTVEDPIEQVVEGVSQVQVTEKVSFAKALRSFLRHDPDVMLVGEIRDYETAETAIRAAMTGHLVLSTLHTNSAVAAVSRLVDIGCAPFLIAATLEGVMAQRLLRKICPHCKYERPATEDECRLLNVPFGQTLYQGKGCSHCVDTGFKGRVGIYETLWINEALRQIIHSGADESDIQRQAEQDDLLITLWEDAKAKVLAGQIALSEASVLRN